MTRVLIIDDDAAFRQSLAKHLERAGHDVRQASQGDAGIRAHEGYNADVVLVDIFMPGQGGLQTIDQLRRRWPAVKIVAITGSAPTGPLDVAQHAVALGADRFLRKPLEAATVLTLLATLLGAPKERSP
jgi:CheY-like chemotaxis protein